MEWRFSILMDINGFFPMLNHRNVCIVRYFLHNLIMDKYIFLFVKEHFSTTGLDIPSEHFSLLRWKSLTQPTLMNLMENAPKLHPVSNCT